MTAAQKHFEKGNLVSPYAEIHNLIVQPKSFRNAKSKLEHERVALIIVHTVSNLQETERRGKVHYEDEDMQRIAGQIPLT